MQAIAWVNRVFSRTNRGGLVVDYIGIANELKAALKEYTGRKGKGRPTEDVRRDSETEACDTFSLAMNLP